MSVTILPTVAANLAFLVYAIENGAYLKRDLMPFTKQWDFDLASDDIVINASSGTAGALRKSSGFCTVARGKDLFKDHLLILVRGTSSGYDWASDGTFGFSRSKSGHMVHMGFYQVFRELLDNGLRQSLAKGGRPLKVHCIGHSLGGALATLIAEWIMANKLAAETALYTFGSPRVGSASYSKYAEALIGLNNIHRVFHQQDPVTMVPLWPFTHLPPNSILRLGGGGSAYINFMTHRMAASYIPLIQQKVKSVNGNSWESLEDRSWVPSNERQLKKWLESDGVLSFTVNTLNLLGEAIAWVFGKVFKALGISVQFVLSTGMTLLDQLAQVLYQGVKVVVEMSSVVILLIHKIMRLLGRKVVGTVEDISAALIRDVFKQLQRRMRKDVNNAFAIVNEGK